MSCLYPLTLPEAIINDKVILITGGTGTFGHYMTRVLLTKFNPRKIIVFSRDEYKQYMMKKWAMNIGLPLDKIRFFIGDVRDYDRLEDAFSGVHIVFHAAALKQVPAIEYNPMEAIKTNINGSNNVIRAAIRNNVNKVVAISTDKCVNPTNLYGATKLCLEKLFVSSNVLSPHETLFSVARYGNVFASRGSVAPVFQAQKEKGACITITHPEMTRFNITKQEAIHFVLQCLHHMQGGEIFVPILPSYSILQLANVIAPENKTKIIGIRPGEKIHECMLSEHESYLAYKCKSFYIVVPQEFDISTYSGENPEKCKEGFCYSSGDNEMMSDEKLLAVYEESVNEGAI